MMRFAAIALLLLAPAAFAGETEMELVPVSVPGAGLARGEAITSAKLKTVMVRPNKIKDGDITEEGELVGLEAKRPVAAGKILNGREVGPKALVKKGDVVTIIYTSGPMQITAKAEALKDGAKGERIDAMNTKSKKVISARVLDADTLKAD